MPAYRTPVRYKGSRCGLCSYCGCSRVRQFCAYPACYIYSRWRRPRAPLGPPLRVLNISAPFRFALRYSVSFFYIPSRSASRPASRFACRSCVSPCVPLGVSFCVFCLSYRPCVSSFRFAFHACPWAIAFDMGTVLPCSPLTLPCRLSHFVVLYSVPRLAVASRPACVPFCVSFVRLALRAVSFVSLAVSFCVPFSLLICGARPDLRVGRRFVLLAACRLVLRLVLGVCVSALYAALAFRPCVSLLRFAMRSVLRSDMRAALYHAWLLARGRWFP